MSEETGTLPACTPPCFAWYDRDKVDATNPGCQAKVQPSLQFAWKQAGDSLHTVMADSVIHGESHLAAQYAGLSPPVRIRGWGRTIILRFWRPPLYRLSYPYMGAIRRSHPTMFPDP